MAKCSPTFYALRWLLAAVFLLVCGCSVKTKEQWYPNYSLYRIAPPKKIVIFVHGYDGTDESFNIMPYLDGIQKENITPMFFNYKTDLLFFQGNLEPIGIIADSLREFIHEKVFQRFPEKLRPIGPKEVTIVCHSTGCPIALTYVTNNPFNHGVKTIITVAGAHYGAELAEAWSKLWSILSDLHTNKQIFELKYGSMDLFHMQIKLHHLLEKQKSKKKWEEPELQNTAFKDFQYVINESIDYTYRENHFNLNLPKVISVVGRDGFWSFCDKYSDEVIRVESAIPDCRLLEEAPKLIKELNQTERWSGGKEGEVACDNRFILFLPCDHTSLFSDSKCRDPILALIQYDLTQEDKKKNAEWSLRREYKKAIGNRENFKSYLKGLRMAALWIKLEYPLNADVKDQKIQTKVFLSDNANSTEIEPKYEREFNLTSEKIYYYKYLEAPLKLSLEISQDGKPLTLRRIIRSETQGALSTNLKFSVNSAQTTMIWCISQKESNSQMDCEVLTESRGSS